jgi:hypothetical protein
MVSGNTFVLTADCAIQGYRNDMEAFDPPTAALIAKRPGTQMRAVVSQDAIATFAQPRACPLHHLATLEDATVMSNSDLASMRETLERNLFHRSAPQSICKAGVMDDAAVTDVDTVMRVKRSWGDEMGCEWGICAGAQ